MEYYPGFNIEVNSETMDFVYGEGVFGPPVEKRTLDAIRSSLMDKNARGPEIVYSIAMDVGNIQDQQDLIQRGLLYGIVTYAKGSIGKEPIRSQGHIHAISKYSQASTCEVYEILDGEAYIYMQEFGGDDAGHCYAVYAKAGDVVIVPPNWVHATINANPSRTMTFGAWCVRDYAFEYEAVRKHHGIAFYPILEGAKVCWQKNTNYQKGSLLVINAQTNEDFGVVSNVPIYTQYTNNKDLFDFVVYPNIKASIWQSYVERMEAMCK